MPASVRRRGDRRRVQRAADSHAAASASRAFGQPEVQHLHRAVLADFDVGGLQVPMDDPLLVRGFERLGNLLGDREGLVDRDRPARNPIGERRALDKLHHEGRACTPSAFFEPVDLGDVRMVEGGEHLRLPLETREAIGIVGNSRQQDFDRDQCDSASCRGAL